MARAPLENLPDGPFVASARTFLDERRLGVTEDRLRLLLKLGRDREVIEVGEDLLATHPLRESVWETVILALYRSGRQADALARYRACRELLLDELGVEPMPGLQMLERQILNHDRVLVPAVRPTSALVIPSRPGPAARRPARPCSGPNGGTPTWSSPTGRSSRSPNVSSWVATPTATSSCTTRRSAVDMRRSGWSTVGTCCWTCRRRTAPGSTTSPSSSICSATATRSASATR